ncbi:hypothetical protein [Candidatus Alkanophaga liquidiphilum]
MPVVASAPQWLEERALGDCCLTFDCGFFPHVCPDPFVSGSGLVAKLLTKTLPTGGRPLVERAPQTLRKS